MSDNETTEPKVFIIESLDFEDEEKNLFEGQIISSILKLSKIESKYYYVRTKKEFEKVMTYVLGQYASLNEVVPLGEKWTGGTMKLQPANLSLQPKEIPIETFFHKIVMLRDRLRVLEQNINSHSVLTDEEKVDLQQYITRIYGSLTTFNILFSEKEHYFVGAKSK